MKRTVGVEKQKSNEISTHGMRTSNELISNDRLYNVLTDMNSNLLSLVGQTDTNQLKDNEADFRNGIPSSFNPRTASNMPTKEKVNKWMNTLPVHLIGGELSLLACYPAVATLSAHSDTNFDFGETQDILEFQSRKITQFATELYLNENEPIRHGQPLQEEDFVEAYYENMQYDDQILRQHVDPYIYNILEDSSDFKSKKVWLNRN